MCVLSRFLQLIISQSFSIDLMHNDVYPKLNINNRGSTVYTDNTHCANKSQRVLQNENDIGLDCNISGGQGTPCPSNFSIQSDWLVLPSSMWSFSVCSPVYNLQFLIAITSLVVNSYRVFQMCRWIFMCTCMFLCSGSVKLASKDMVWSIFVQYLFVGYCH